MQVGKIYNMDCVQGMRKMSGQSVALIVTDIPYGNVSRNGAERAKYSGQIRKIDKEHADTETFDLETFLDECYRVVKGSIYIFCGIEQVSTVFSYFDGKKDMMTRHCTWRKTNPSPMNGQHMWLNSIENCVFAKKRKSTFNQVCKPSAWDFPVGRSKIHPTEKPLKLFEYLILSSSNEGDIVLDPCIGSGTTAIACLDNERNYIGFELNSDYTGLANKRISEWHENNTRKLVNV